MKYLSQALLMIILAGCQTPVKKESQDAIDQESTSKSKIALVDLQGNELTPKGKVLILNLWATWCKPCVEEMPVLEKMMNKLPDDFELILASDEDIARINAFVSARSFTLNFGQIQTSMESLGVYSLPTTLIIDQKGQILETLVGARDWDSPEQLAQLLSFKP